MVRSPWSERASEWALAWMRGALASVHFPQSSKYIHFPLCISPAFTPLSLTWSKCKNVKIGTYDWMSRASRACELQGDPVNLSWSNVWPLLRMASFTGPPCLFWHGLLGRNWERNWASVSCNLSVLFCWMSETNQACTHALPSCLLLTTAYNHPTTTSQSTVAIFKSTTLYISHGRRRSPCCVF